MLLEKDIQVKYTKAEMITLVNYYLILDIPVAIKVIDLKMLKN